MVPSLLTHPLQFIWKYEKNPEDYDVVQEISMNLNVLTPDSGGDD